MGNKPSQAHIRSPAPPKGELFCVAVQFATKAESLLAREYPFRHRLRRCHTPPFVATRHLPPTGGSRPSRGRLQWRWQSFRQNRKVCLSGGYPFRLAAARQSTFPKGTAFSGGDKVSDIATRRPLGGAGERSEPEGVTPQRRAFAESGAATAVFHYDPICENGTPERPQTLRCSKI